MSEYPCPNCRTTNTTIDISAVEANHDEHTIKCNNENCSVYRFGAPPESSE